MARSGENELLELTQVKATALANLVELGEGLIGLKVKQNDKMSKTILRVFRKSHLVAKSILSLGTSPEQYIAILALARILVENAASLDYLGKNVEELDRFHAFALAQYLQSTSPYLSSSQKKKIDKLVSEYGFRDQCGNLRWSTKGVNAMIHGLDVSKDIKDNLEHGYAEGSGKIHLSPIDITNTARLQLRELECGFHTAGNAYYVILLVFIEVFPFPGRFDRRKFAEQVEKIMSDLYEKARSRNGVSKAA